VFTYSAGNNQTFPLDCADNTSGSGGTPNIPLPTFATPSDHSSETPHATTEAPHRRRGAQSVMSMPTGTATANSRGSQNKTFTKAEVSSGKSNKEELRVAVAKLANSLASLEVKLS
jgi:hypothetical protein